MVSFKRFLPKSMRKDEISIPVVRLHGAIMTSSGPFRPALNLASAAPLLERAFNDKRAPAVAISVNSPGGSPVQSRLIHNRIRELAAEKNKPVLMFVEDVAASGGYMIAIAGDEIFADPSSIVGSIGVVSAGFGFTELMAKVGVERRVYTAGENKFTLDPFQPERPKDIKHLKTLQLDVHQVFIDMVKASRGDKLADDKDMFSGLFWSGGRAQELGLIDALGDMRTVIKQRYGEKAKLTLVSPVRGLFGRRTPGVGLMGLGVGEGLAERFSAGLVSRAAQIAEERNLWSRFGL